MKYTLIYFSPTGETKKINDYYADHLQGCRIIDITNYQTRINFNFSEFYEFIIISLPVYSQDIPSFLKTFLRKLNGRFAIINTTFGAISPGNGLHNAAKILKKKHFKIIGASIIPTNHCYLDSQNNLPITEPLSSMIEKINQNNLQEIKLPKQKKNILANILPIIRAKLAVKLITDFEKCTKCKLCVETCPVNAIKNDLKLNNHCIRCLRCVNICESNARSYKRSLFLNQYLKKYQLKIISPIVIK